jgi:hypothetical protein
MADEQTNWGSRGGSASGGRGSAKSSARRSRLTQGPSVVVAREEADTSLFAAATGMPNAAPPAREVPAAPARPAPPPTPPPGLEEPQRRRTPWVILALAVLGAAVWTAVSLAGRGENTTPTATPTPSGQTSASPTSSPTGPPGTTVSAEFPGTAKADTATLQVQPLAPKDARCTTHTVGGNAAYVSDCLDWADRAPVLYFFYVTLQNKDTDTLEWRRGAFTVSGGDTYKPIEVRKQAGDPTAFLPKQGTLGSGDSIAAYLVFEVDRAFDPSSLQYEGQGLSLAIQFVGATAEVPAG